MTRCLFQKARNRNKGRAMEESLVGQRASGRRRWWLCAWRKRPELLYFCAIVREFRVTLLLLGAAVAFGGFLYRVTPEPELGNQRPSLALGLYAAWMAMLAQPVFSVPSRWYVELMCALYPIFGALLIGEGVVRFAMLMISRRHGEKEWMRVMASTYQDHIVLCGLGHLGIRVLEQLVSSGVPVVAIEKDGEGRFVPAAKALKIPVLIGDMKEDQILLEAGIRYARGVICCTNDDMANLEVALDARRFNAGIRVVLRQFDQQIAGKIADAMMVDAAFSTSALAAPVVAAMSLDMKVMPTAVIDGVAHVTAELNIGAGSVLAGRKIGEVETEHRMRVLSRTARGSGGESPPAVEARIAEGDQLLVHIATSGLADLARACHHNMARSAGAQG